MSEQPQPSTRQLVLEIANALGETEAQPRNQIRRIIKVMGWDFAQDLLRETQAIEAQGGLFLERENRRRTPGGVFFYLARNQMTKKQRGMVFDLATDGKRSTPEIEDLPEVLQELMNHYGKASSMKITLLGRPGQVVDRGQVVIFGLVSEKHPPLPKGLPEPPRDTKYLVLVTKKQWNKVAEAIKAADDTLIIEGYPTYDTRHPGIMVYTTTVTTKKLQAAKRAAQQAQTGS